MTTPSAYYTLIRDGSGHVLQAKSYSFDPTAVLASGETICTYADYAAAIAAMHS